MKHIEGVPNVHMSNPTEAAEDPLEVKVFDKLG